MLAGNNLLPETARVAMHDDIGRVSAINGSGS
jgi:hypothetical protein